MQQLIHSSIIQKLESLYKTPKLIQLIDIIENHINPQDFQKICILKLEFEDKFLNFEVLINSGYSILDFWFSQPKDKSFSKNMHFELGIAVLELTTNVPIGDMETKILSKDKVCFEIEMDLNFKRYLSGKYSKWVYFKNQNWN